MNWGIMSHPPTPMALLKHTDKEIRQCRQQTPAAPWMIRAVKFWGATPVVNTNTDTPSVTQHIGVLLIKKYPATENHLNAFMTSNHLLLSTWQEWQVQKCSCFNCTCTNMHEEQQEEDKEKKYLWDLCRITTWLNWVISTGRNHQPPKPFRKPWTGSAGKGGKDLERQRHSI